jgi:hypothetical protein
MRIPRWIAREQSPSLHHAHVSLLGVSQQTATGVIAAAGIVIGFVALGIVAWIFWRAAKRDREAGN